MTSGYHLIELIGSEIVLIPIVRKSMSMIRAIPVIPVIPVINMVKFIMITWILSPLIFNMLIGDAIR